jgi:hypothetical protein
VEEIKSLKPDIWLPVVYLPHLRGYKYTVKKEKKIFLIYKKSQNGAVAYKEGLSNKLCMRRPLVICDFATAPL